MIFYMLQSKKFNFMFTLSPAQTNVKKHETKRFSTSAIYRLRYFETKKLFRESNSA